VGHQHKGSKTVPCQPPAFHTPTTIPHAENVLVKSYNMANESEKSLFGHCTFAFVINKDLPKSQAELVRYFEVPLRANY
jgi:hypothetical protein